MIFAKNALLSVFLVIVFFVFLSFGARREGRVVENKKATDSGDVSTMEDSQDRQTDNELTGAAEKAGGAGNTAGDIRDIVDIENIIRERIDAIIATGVILDGEDSVDPMESEDKTIPFNDINESVRRALVNIICTTKSWGLLKPISGSGIIIDPRGIILTNAHVAQYFLLKDYYTPGYITCIIRTGSPAISAYNAEPLYISEDWIYTNAEKIDTQNATGNGQYDYALLGITATISGEDIKYPIPYVAFSDSPALSSGAPIYIGGYPAGFIGGITVQKNLNITSTLGIIDDVFTFIEKTPDLITVKGSIVSQHGVSGGAVVDEYGDLIGIVVTSTAGDSTADRVLGAITTDYIERDFERQVGLSLFYFLQYDVIGTAESFWEVTAPPLINALETALNN